MNPLPPVVKVPANGKAQSRRAILARWIIHPGSSLTLHDLILVIRGMGDVSPGPRARAMAKRKHEEEVEMPEPEAGPSTRRGEPQVVDAVLDDPEDLTMVDADVIAPVDLPYAPGRFKPIGVSHSELWRRPRDVVGGGLGGRCRPLTGTNALPMLPRSFSVFFLLCIQCAYLYHPVRFQRISSA
jgi:hypothetical protein